MQTDTVRVYIETGSKRVFAGAIDWPGWCRNAREEAGALTALFDYGQRYQKAVGALFCAPETPAALEVVERLEGGYGTDFGVPYVPLADDATSLTGAELDRYIALQRAAWAAFDRTAHDTKGHELRKGPRGGGRDVARMVEHVLGGQQSYLGELGGKAARSTGDDPWADLAEVRDASIQMLRERAAGFEPTPGPRRKKPFWTPRFFMRYSAWHTLDHAWEIEDRRQ